jgi:hypothetical protein
MSYGELTSVEQSLVEHVGRGDWLDLAAGDEAVDETAMRSWGESRTCRAAVIRDILRGRLVADPDPHGLRLQGARITGRIDLESLATDVNLELRFCLLEEGVMARAARLRAFSLVGCQIEHPAEPPLEGSLLTCSVLSLRGARVIGHADRGAVILFGAHIGGSLTCTGAQLRNDSGPALYADGLQVGQAVDLRDGFIAIGTGGHGAVRLLIAHIGGSLNFTGAELRNDSGPALTVDGLQVGQAMHLSDGFIAIGSGGLGAVRMVAAHIGATFDCIGAELRNDSGSALCADGLQVGQAVYLRGFTAVGGGKAPAVDLTGARVDRVFLFAPTRLEHKVDSHKRLAANGLTYAGVPSGISPQDWRELLRDGTRDYAAQPYQQLAAGYRALGDDRQARQTLMAQRDDQLARADTGWQDRLWGRITKVTLGYGYQPWRALWFLVGVVAVSCMLAVVLGSHGALAQTSKTATPGRSCTVVQQVSVGLDLNLPVGTSVARAECDLTTDSARSTAAWLAAVGWVLRVLAWTFAALFIAGFTSAVRKT